MKVRTKTKSGLIGPGDFLVTRALTVNHNQTLRVRTGIKAGAVFPGWEPQLDAQEDAERSSTLAAIGGK